MVKEIVFTAAQRLGILSYLDHVLFILKIFKNKRTNLAIKNIPSDFQWPSNRLIFDTYGHVHLPFYHTSGLEDAGLVAEVLHLHIPQKELNILDWGCGTGRVICHLKDFLPGRNIDLYGSDCDPKVLKWCQQNISQAKFAANDLDPPLPFKDGFFDVVYGFSVLPHLSEKRQIAWLKELNRVLKKGGLALLSTQGYSYMKYLKKEEGAQFQEGGLVVRPRTKEGARRFLSYHPKNYMEKLLQDWQIVDHLDETNDKYSPHDLWVIKKN